ncbi:MAG: protease modulator HflK, partial [Gammaproteobacteria bacterium]
MAWNQPGGNGDKDPWGDRGGKQGPPDLDELLKNLQGKLAGIFGGGRPGGGRIGGGKINLGGGGSIGLGLILVVALIGWAVAGVYIVDQAEQGVVLRFGKFVRTTEPGPHWLPYFVEKVEKVNIQQLRSQDVGFRSAGGSQSSVPNESLMLTEDENIIDIKLAVQYRVTDPNTNLSKLLAADN